MNTKMPNVLKIKNPFLAILTADKLIVHLFLI